MDIEKQEIYKTLAIVAQKFNIKKWHFETQSLSEDIVHYMANLYPVALIDEDSGETMHLIIKRAPVAAELEDILSNFYSREVYFYSNLLPIFENDIIHRLQLTIPKCLYADSSKNNRVLVLQDVRTKGFRRYEKGFYLDQEHLVVALKMVAEFHALSITLNERKIEPPNAEVLSQFTSTDPSYHGKTLRHCLNKYLFLFKDMTCESILSNLCQYINSSGEYLDGCTAKAKCLVYGHGDLWKENIMFQYSNNKPVGICLVDYQITRRMSPAADVLFLIMNSTESCVRRKNYRSFISIYFKTLQQILQDGGLKLEKNYTEEDFEHDVKLVFPSCLCLTFLSFLMWLKLEDPVSITCKSPDIQIDHDNIAIFKQIISDLVLDFVHFGLIDDIFVNQSKIDKGI